MALGSMDNQTDSTARVEEAEKGRQQQCWEGNNDEEERGVEEEEEEK